MSVFLSFCDYLQIGYINPMPKTCCCVPLCANRGGHKFPQDRKLKKQWLIAIRRDKWKHTASSVVCKRHFKPEDYIQHTYYGEFLNRTLLLAVW